MARGGEFERVIENIPFLKKVRLKTELFCFIIINYNFSKSSFDTNGATAIMEEIVGKALTNSYYKRLAYLEGAQIMTLAEYGKINKLSHSNLINKANRQTIEAFLEKGVWKIGVAQKKWQIIRVFG